MAPYTNIMENKDDGKRFEIFSNYFPSQKMDRKRQDAIPVLHLPSEPKQLNVWKFLLFSAGAWWKLNLWL
ncbi:hypothetical protein CRP01_33415 [Flavilitoribacter nigricans DSM 23189 = NBRC 102662]|uniref:Uncharacterized protein n=1 Tax=Flavilitoribacter nigricans (strain ATCC 23147 / DSM 23189 / NBRC 102662 / NCIMB 1420 / SS-2) TaxID=1122177 RepID=A0A2D0N159_FLAN2|nr:hypothetical protein CRP01_33415 [Flavilitoribacter nigricans DSM 23189 = NBRC 102662]